MFKSPKAKNSKTETEAALGPLPDGWSRSTTADKKRTFFINHNLKITTWIDPRTKKLRKTDLEKLEPGELPYGWDELYDSKFGYYYADHNNEQNYAEPPWSSDTRERTASSSSPVTKSDARNVAAMALGEVKKRQQSKPAAADKVEDEEKTLASTTRTLRAKLTTLQTSLDERLAQEEKQFVDHTRTRYEELLAAQRVQIRAVKDEYDALKMIVTKSMPVTTSYTSKMPASPLMAEMKNKTLKKTDSAPKMPVPDVTTSGELSGLAKEADRKQKATGEKMQRKAELEAKLAEKTKIVTELGHDLEALLLKRSDIDEEKQVEEFMHHELDVLVFKKKIQAERQHVRDIMRQISGARRGTDAPVPDWIKKVGAIGATGSTKSLKPAPKGTPSSLRQSESLRPQSQADDSLNDAVTPNKQQ